MQQMQYSGGGVGMKRQATWDALPDIDFFSSEQLSLKWSSQCSQGPPFLFPSLNSSRNASKKRIHTHESLHLGLLRISLADGVSL